MKILKTLLIMLVALLLTGCYTQLQYSQKMNKITDRNPEEVEQKTQNGQAQTDNGVTKESAEEYAEYSGEEEYVPIPYKDYDYVNKYRDCNCSPYNVYNFYGSPYDRYAYDYYRPYYSYRSYHSFYYSYHDWFHHRYFGFPRFSIAFSWGSPHYYHSFYHDPFFYRYSYSPFAYNYHRYYGSFGYGHYYGGQKVRDNRRDNVSYGPRSIGTNRVTSGSRVRNDNSRSTTVKSGSVARTRSVGTARSQDTVSRNGNVTRTRSQGTVKTSSGNTRTRSRDNIQSDNRKVYIDRTDESTPVLIDRERYNAIRARVAAESSASRSLNRSDMNANNLRKVRGVNYNSSERETPTFLQRMKSVFKNSTSRITNSTRSSSSTVRSRSSSSSNRSSVSRSKSSSSNSSSVSRSKSSSSNSRSRGGSSSSSSRSRSGGDSGSSDRSRGN